MGIYRCLRPLLFALDAERAHDLTLSSLALLSRVPGALPLITSVNCAPVPHCPVRVAGLDFAHPLGLAAGLDKSASAAQAFCALGFSYVELGTVTLRPQPGNPRPRLFRLPEHRAIINRMGFNSVGVEAFLRNLQGHRPTCPVGISIGKNKDTPEAAAADEYRTLFHQVAAHADYVAVNISSPNTPGLRALQETAALDTLLVTLKRAQTEAHSSTGRYTPIAVKIAPDLIPVEIARLAQQLREHGMDAVIATNTTLTRPGVETHPGSAEAGGLSGRPLKSRTREIVRLLHAELREEVPIIAVGGIETTADAQALLDEGASLLQLYTALIYQGPGVVSEIVRGLSAASKRPE